MCTIYTLWKRLWVPYYDKIPYNFPRAVSFFLVFLTTHSIYSTIQQGHKRLIQSWTTIANVVQGIYSQNMKKSGACGMNFLSRSTGICCQSSSWGESPKISWNSTFLWNYCYTKRRDDTVAKPLPVSLLFRTIEEELSYFLMKIPTFVTIPTTRRSFVYLVIYRNWVAY